MENIEELKEALCDVRRAHRIIYSYQARMLDLIKFISAKLNYTRIEGATKYFSNGIRKGEENLLHFRFLKICGHGISSIHI